MFYWILKIVFWLPVSLFFPVIWKNRRKIPKGKAIFVVNHISNADVIILIDGIWKKQHFMAKKELFTGFKKCIFKAMDAIPVDRENVGISTIKQCLTVLKKNKVLTIFPEGTRNKTREQDLLPLKPGAGLLALKSGAPIIPIWIKNKQKAFCFNKIIVGEPFYITKENFENADELIKNNLLCLKPTKN